MKIAKTLLDEINQIKRYRIANRYERLGDHYSLYKGKPEVAALFGYLTKTGDNEPWLFQVGCIVQIAGNRTFDWRTKVALGKTGKPSKKWTLRIQNDERLAGTIDGVYYQMETLGIKKALLPYAEIQTDYALYVGRITEEDLVDV